MARRSSSDSDVERALNRLCDTLSSLYPLGGGIDLQRLVDEFLDQCPTTCMEILERRLLALAAAAADLGPGMDDVEIIAHARRLDLRWH